MTCSAEGVTVGSLKMAPILARGPSFKVWSFDASRAAAPIEELPGARVDVGLEPVLEHQLGGIPRHLLALNVDHGEALDLALGGEAVA